MTINKVLVTDWFKNFKKKKKTKKTSIYKLFISSFSVKLQNSQLFNFDKDNIINQKFQ